MPPEKLSAPRERFRWQERSELLDQLLATAAWYRSNFVYTAPHLDQYAELLAVTKIFTEEELSSRARSHLSQMGSLEGRRAKPPTESAGDIRFWQQLPSIYGKNWQKAQSFAEDLSDAPKAWGRARDDLLLLSSALREEKHS